MRVSADVDREMGRDETRREGGLVQGRTAGDDQSAPTLLGGSF